MRYATISSSKYFHYVNLRLFHKQLLLFYYFKVDKEKYYNYAIIHVVTLLYLAGFRQFITKLVGQNNNFNIKFVD